MKLILKGFISGLILYSIFRKIDIQPIVSTLKTVDLTALILPFLLLFIIAGLMALKWHIFIRRFSPNTTLKNIFITYWASDFMNLLSLGSLGNETYKVLAFKNKTKAILATLTDKVLSLIWYCLLVIVFYITNQVALSIILFALAAHGLTKLFKIFPKIVREVKESELLLHSIYSLLIIGSRFVANALVFRAVGVDFEPDQLFIFIAVMIVAVSLPISYQGLGVREYLYLQFAYITGQEPEKVLAVSLLLYVVGLLYKVSGLIPFSFSRVKLQY